MRHGPPALDHADRLDLFEQDIAEQRRLLRWSFAFIRRFGEPFQDRLAAVGTSRAYSAQPLSDAEIANVCLLALPSAATRNALARLAHTADELGTALPYDLARILRAAETERP